MIETCQRIETTEMFGRELRDLDEAIVIMEAVRQRGHTTLGEASLEVARSSDPWSGTSTIEDAIRIARFGWPEGRELMRETIDQLDTEELVGLRPVMEPHPDVAGDDVDVDRYLSGDHENMTQYELKYDQNGKVVNLYVNCSVSAYVTPQQIIKRGAAILGAAELLTSSGYAMGITMVESTKQYDTQVEYHIPLVSPGGYLDLDTAAFCLAHPSFLRRLVFALNDNEPRTLRQKMGFMSEHGYGTPSHIRLPLPSAAIVIDKHEGLDLSSQEQITAYTKSILKRAAEKLDQNTSIDT